MRRLLCRLGLHRFEPTCIAHIYACGRAECSTVIGGHP